MMGREVSAESRSSPAGPMVTAEAPSAPANSSLCARSESISEEISFARYSPR
jgi:hypothetical protein